MKIVVVYVLATWLMGEVPATMAAQPAVLPEAPVEALRPAVVEEVFVTEAPPAWTLSAGTGFYLLQPYFNGNPAGVLKGSSGGVAYQEQIDFGHAMQLAPLAWIGYTSAEGIGGRIRYFGFAQDSWNIIGISSGTTFSSARPLGVTAITAGSGEAALYYSDLKLNVWDFEAIKIWQLDDWDVLASAGLRYAHISQDYYVSTSGLPKTKGAEIIDSGHNFNGAGPTVSVDTRRLLGRRFALYSKTRASLLFGSAHQSARRETYSSSGILVGGDDATSHQSGIVPVGDMEFGGEYGTSFGRLSSFVQLGFVGQVWLSTGNAANTSALNTSASSASTSNLGFLGMVFRWGLAF